MVNIRRMKKADIERVGEIFFGAFTANVSKYGYGARICSVREGVALAWAMSRYSGTEVWVAEVDDRVVAAISVNPRGINGGIGPLAIDPQSQRKGTGRMLLEAVVKMMESEQSLRAIQEAFNPTSFALCYSIGFMPVALLFDLYMDGDVRRISDGNDNVNEFRSEDMEAVYEYDLSRSRLDRRVDFAYYRRWGKIFVYRVGSELRGFLACLPGPQSVQLGPLVAEGQAEAESLYRHALGAFNGKAFRTCVMAKDRSLVTKLMETGFKVYCMANLIVVGSWRPGEYVEGFGWFPEGA